MHCLICQSDTEYYFSKTYSEYPISQFMKDIGTVDYYKCKNCGFVLSKTHANLTPARWTKLNNDFHHYFEDPKNKTEINQPPYPEQALMLLLLGAHGIIDTRDWIDYAAGYGTLSKLLQKYFKMHLPIYDPYVNDGDPSRYINDQDLRSYKTVINSAMFEHVLNREDLEKVNRIVADDGCLILHTHVSEIVPRDPNWFYLRPPVHTAFYTNKSMEILMEQWGYCCSIYSPKSKCWIMLKNDYPHLADQINTLNEELQSGWFHFKYGFMDYWK